VEREREDERIMNQLEQEFSKMDANQDGTIT
jgi:Ca2+-binding EF-hand superfamily protein